MKTGCEKFAGSISESHWRGIAKTIRVELGIDPDQTTVPGNIVWIAGSSVDDMMHMGGRDLHYHCIQASRAWKQIKTEGEAIWLRENLTNGLARVRRAAMALAGTESLADGAYKAIISQVLQGYDLHDIDD